MQGSGTDLFRDLQISVKLPLHSHCKSNYFDHIPWATNLLCMYGS